MPTSPCGVCLIVSLPPALMQLTDAGLAISATGTWGLSDGEQAQLARARAQRVMVCVHPSSMLTGSRKYLAPFFARSAPHV